MEEEESPIFHFYPSEFKTDLNGKKQEWEAVVLIPFIDEVIRQCAVAVWSPDPHTKFCYSTKCNIVHTLL
jgi:5'-3' exonuclease